MRRTLEIIGGAMLTAILTAMLLRAIPERIVCERCHESLEVTR